MDVTRSGLTFQILADPSRRRILEHLRPGERSVGTLVTELGLSQPGVSRHLRILHHAGFVRSRAEGQHRFYSLRREPFRELDAWIQQYRSLVEGRLDRIEQLVKSEGAETNATAGATTRSPTWKPK